MGACSSKNAAKKAPSDDSSTDRESLFTAVETDNTHQIAKLLKRGIDVDARDENDYTALLLAAETGATASVGTLIKAGADRDARDSYGRSAVYAAAVGGKDETVAKLLEAGASPTNADRDGRGPFWAACATRDVGAASAVRGARGGAAAWRCSGAPSAAARPSAAAFRRSRTGKWPAPAPA